MPVQSNGSRSGSGVSRAAASVAEFHVRFGLHRQAEPNARIDAGVAALRVRLLEEEVGELAEATDNRDIVEIADALADIVYLAYGAAVTYGIDLDAVFDEVHRSNMTKLGDDGKPLLREDGKVIKPATFQPPDVKRVLADQAPLPLEAIELASAVG
ncbi:MAG TPA: nucleoside triphosphate pyrophosphohydrolase family protein [Candidatus Limnocylindrales bacterium]